MEDQAGRVEGQVDHEGQAQRHLPVRLTSSPSFDAEWAATAPSGYTESHWVEEVCTTSHSRSKLFLHPAITCNTAGRHKLAELIVSLERVAETGRLRFIDVSEAQEREVSPARSRFQRNGSMNGMTC